MKVGRTSLIVMATVLGLATLSLTLPQQRQKLAGRVGDPSARIERQIERMAKKLALTEAQQEDWRLILEDQSKKMKEIRQDSSLAQEQKREMINELRKETQPKIQEILSEEQYGQWQEIQKQRQERREQRAQGPGEGT